MAGASAIRGGGVSIEIGADVRKVYAALNAVQTKLQSFGQAMTGVGVKIAGLGAAASVPFAAAIRAVANFESTLLAVKASAGVTEAELDQVKAVAMQMSSAMSMGPTEIANSFLELLKAGVKLEDVLGGVGQAAVQFAKVGEMELGPAAVTLSNAMNVFGVDASKAANAISSAADASSTSIQLLTQSFSMAAAVAALANQTIDDTSAALAVLANSGIKGSDAGTSLKTMLMRLMAPAEDAAGAMKQLGLSTHSFREADGRMKPIAKIIDTLNDKLQGMDQAAKDDVFRRIFGQDAIRAASILVNSGSAGFDAMAQSMRDAMPLGKKFDTMMSGLAGSGSAVLASLQRFGIAVSASLGGDLQRIAKGFVRVADGVTAFLSGKEESAALAQQIMRTAVAATAAGAAFVAAGLALKTAAIAVGGFSAALSVVTVPLSAVTSAAALVVGSFASTGAAAASIGGGMVKATTALVGLQARAAAMATGYATSMATAAASSSAFALRSSAALAGPAVAGLAGFATAVKSLITYYTGALAGMQAITISRAGATAAAWIASTAGIDTFANATKTSLSRASRAASATMDAMMPAIDFLGRGFSAVASDARRMAGAIPKPFAQAAQGVTAFATSTAAGVGAYVASVARAVASSVTGTAQIASAWVSQAASGVYQFAAGIASPIAAYVASTAAAVGASVTAAASIVGAWLSTAFPAVSAFAAGAASSVAAYVASTAAAAAASIANAAKSGAAWVTSGMPGLAAFVGGAVSALGTYLAAAAAAVAGSVASATAVAAAWLAPLAPVAALGAALAGVGALAYGFRGEISAAMGGVGQMANDAAGAIGGTFSSALNSAKAVFTDLYATAKTTMQGIFDAVSAGDMAGAFTVMWAGARAAWLTGTAPIMGYIDELTSYFQNAWGDAIAYLAIAITQGMSTVENIWDAATHSLTLAWKVSMNKVLDIWDTAVGAIQKAIAYIRSFMDKAVDYKAIKRQIDEANRQRKEARDQQVAAADPEFAKRVAQREKRDAGVIDTIVADNEQAKLERADRSMARSDQRNAEIAVANSELAGARGAVRESSMVRDVGGATSVEQLQAMHALAEEAMRVGEITTEQFQRIQDAIDNQALEVDRTRALGEQERRTQEEKARGMEGAAAAAGIETAGTFSTAAAAMLGQGTSLAERTAKAAEETAKHTKEMADGGKVQT